MTNPSKIVCIGLNYKQHAAESGAEPPAHPVLFLKNSGALQNPGDPIVLPRKLRSDEVDYECELAVVIGRRCHNVPRDQALDHAAEQFAKIAEKYTRCGVLFTPGSDMQSTFVRWFAEVFGSYNVTTHESSCLLSRNRAYLDTFGEVPFSDILHSKYIIMAGANRFEALITPDSIDLMTAKKNGCKLVVLDPRYTKTAAHAHEWYAIKPGTDMAFFLAVAQVLISEKLYDQKFVDEYTSGFDEFRTHVQQ